jgi:hypothetical protein
MKNWIVVEKLKALQSRTKNLMVIEKHLLAMKKMLKILIVPHVSNLDLRKILATNCASRRLWFTCVLLSPSFNFVIGYLSVASLCSEVPAIVGLLFVPHRRAEIAIG